MDRSRFDLEHFQLFLASTLIGGLEEEFTENVEADKYTTTITSTTESGDNRIAIRLQWRSPLLMDIDPVTFKKKKEKEKEEEEVEVVVIDDADDDENDNSSNKDKSKDNSVDLVFLDADFVFETRLITVDTTDDEKDSPSSFTPRTQTDITLTFGALTYEEGDENKYYYTKGEPVTTQYLEDHMDQHGDVLLETASEHNANGMTAVFRRLERGIQCKKDDTTKPGAGGQIQIPLIYEAEQTKPSYLIIQSPTNTSTQVDSNLLTPLLANGHSKIQTNPPPLLSDDDKNILLTRYGEWKQKTSNILKDAAKKARKLAAKKAAAAAAAAKAKAKARASASARAGENEPPPSPASPVVASSRSPSPTSKDTAATAKAAAATTTTTKKVVPNKATKKRKKNQQIPYGFNTWKPPSKSSRAKNPFSKKNKK